MNKNTKYAFPLTRGKRIKDGELEIDKQDGVNGMTLLEYYAGQALIGFLNNNKISWSDKLTAKNCFAQAKAMVKESEKHTQ